VFYECQTKKDQKQPYYFHLEEHQPFAFAGLWERWKSPEKEEIISCTILTTEAHEEMRSIHHRQPIIIPENLYFQWLNPQLTEPQEILPLLVSQPALKHYPVNLVVNKPTHDEPDCIQQSF
jgi:putative SOS response-associated peptidase YedK